MPANRRRAASGAGGGRLCSAHFNCPQLPYYSSVGDNNEFDGTECCFQSKISTAPVSASAGQNTSSSRRVQLSRDVTTLGRPKAFDKPAPAKYIPQHQLVQGGQPCGASTDEATNSSCSDPTLLPPTAHQVLAHRQDCSNPRQSSASQTWSRQSQKKQQQRQMSQTATGGHSGCPAGKREPCWAGDCGGDRAMRSRMPGAALAKYIPQQELAQSSASSDQATSSSCSEPQQPSQPSQQQMPLHRKNRPNQNHRRQCQQQQQQQRSAACCPKYVSLEEEDPDDKYNLTSGGDSDHCYETASGATSAPQPAVNSHNAIGRMAPMMQQRQQPPPQQPTPQAKIVQQLQIQLIGCGQCPACSDSDGSGQQVRVIRIPAFGCGALQWLLPGGGPGGRRSCGQHHQQQLD